MREGQRFTYTEPNELLEGSPDYTESGTLRLLLNSIPSQDGSTEWSVHLDGTPPKSRVRRWIKPEHIITQTGDQIMTNDTTQTIRLYPAVTIDRDWCGNLRMWEGRPVLEHWQDPYPEADVLVQVDIERDHILESLTEEELAAYDAGHMITTHNIDPAHFGDQAAKAEARRQAHNEQVYQQLRRNKGK